MVLAPQFYPTDLESRTLATISANDFSSLNITAENFSYLLGSPSFRKVERMFIFNNQHVLRDE